ncbi:MAG: hypothetical protein ACK4FF_01950 [Limnobacter sp.]|uniref:hypothetical protein n=1 Tax=Limnobacter sp. TaxID=2003368 RepID=UPI00391DD05F
MKTSLSALSVAVLLALTGCNSDGNSSSSTSAPSGTEPRDFSGVTFGYNTTPMTVEAAERIQLDESNALEFARLALVKATAYAINGIVNSRGLELSEQFFQEDSDQLEDSCSGSGSISLQKRDANGNGQIDPKDVFTATFKQCQNANGTLRTDFETYAGSVSSGVLTTNHYVTASNFAGTQPSTGSSASVDGTEGRRIILGSGRFQYIVHAPANAIEESEGGRGRAQYKANSFLDIQGNLSGAGTSTVKMNYKETGDVSTRIDTPTSGAYTTYSDGLSVLLADSAVSSGSLELRSGGIVRVQALGNSSGRYRVRVGLDTNGDGTNERSCDFDYQDILNSTASFSANQCAAQPPGGQDNLPLLTQVPLVGPLLSTLVNPILSTGLNR